MTDTLPTAVPTMQLCAIEKAFDGVPVLRHIDLAVATGEVLGLIGPNGAGKTTLFNIMSGFVASDAGRIHLDGVDITKVDVQSRARMGVVRTFQKSLVFPALSVRSNVAMAVHGPASGYRWWRAARVQRIAHEQADALLEQADLTGRADTLAGALSYGEQRVLDIVIALAQKPKLLLLDEPTAGLSEADADHVLALIKAHRADTAVVLVSHDIDIVMQVCARIAVLDLGVLIATGTPAEVRNDARVIAAYLGMPVQLLAESGQ